jgi:tripartite-type tricarboxylate transporter receptor subunit TctC
MKCAVALLAVAGLGALCQVASTQEWPSRTIRIVSPFAPGGGSDTLARSVAERLSEQLQQQVIVENRGGAGGLIGSAAVANSPPDGYTYLISSIATHVVAPITSANPGYDPIRDFSHVALAGGPPTVLVVHPSLGPKTFGDLLKLLKSRNEELPYVSPGPGTIGNLIAEYWAEKENVKIAHVAYKGAGQAMNDLIAGHVTMGSITWTAAIGQIRAGTVIPLAVSSTNRMPGFPDVPTLKELGYPDLAVTTWFAFAAPAGVPPNIIARMNQGIGTALEAPSVRKHLESQGFEIEIMSPAELTTFIQNQIVKWGPLAKRLTKPK